jgi:hypothetical protein
MIEYGPTNPHELGMLWFIGGAWIDAGWDISPSFQRLYVLYGEVKEE